MTYLVLGAMALIIFGAIGWAIYLLGVANRHVGELTVQKQVDETTIQAVKDKADAEDEVARMSPAARRDELSKWGRG